MLELITKRILIIVSHHDDETLFCGGLLLELSKKNIELDLLVLTDIKNENTNYESKLKEKNFIKIINTLNINYTEFNLKNNLNIEDIDEYESIITKFKSYNDLNYDLILTHNENGEYGHKQHIFTHHFVKKYMDNKIIYVFGDKNSKIKIKIDKEKKYDLIKTYSFKNTDMKKDVWIKQCIKNYTFWIDNKYEYYDKL